MVDDDPQSVRLLTQVLRKAGYVRVDGMTDPAAALESFRDDPPDILLLDLHMPEVDGFEFIEGATVPGTRAAEEGVPIVMLTGDVDPQARLRALAVGAKDFLTKPFDRTEVLLRIANLLETRFLHKEVQEHNVRLEEQVRERTEHLWTAVRDVEEARDGLRRSQEETVRRLSIAAEFRDEETSQHIHRMSEYCALLARNVGFDEDSTYRIRVATQMHDIGKIGIPDDILLKPGKFTPEERTIMEGHAAIGHRILAGSDSKLLQLAALIALHHHERVDGKGYPQRLAGTAIPVEGRIAAIADVFDALTTDRIYRKAFPVATALAMLREGRGTQFDADLLDVFFDLLPEVLTHRERLQDLGPSQHASLQTLGDRSS
ncbi:MAG: response regulator [Actinomycetota bacterium]|nr:response regulator [Actinomycetota bacterium]